MCSAILECWKGRTSCGSQSPFEHFIYTYILYIYNDIVQQCFPLIFSPKWCSFRFTPFLMFGKHKVWQPRVGKNLNWSKFHRAEGLGPCQDDTPFTPFFFVALGSVWSKKKGGGTRFCSPKIFDERYQGSNTWKTIEIDGLEGRNLSFLGAWHLFRWGDDRWYTQLLYMATSLYSKCGSGTLKVA